MSKWVHDDVLDAALDEIGTNCNRVDVCSVAPADRTEAITTYTLAHESMAGGDFTNDDGDVSGRKVTVGAKTGVSIDGTGMATHIGLTDGTRLLYVTELGAVRANTAQAGGASSITLDAGASAVDSFYNDMAIRITANTGEGQTRYITAYNGSTKVATVGVAWSVQPDVTSTFKVFGQSVTSGNTLNIPAWDIEIEDPKVIT